MLALFLEGSPIGHPLNSRPLTIGRGPGNDVTLSDIAVSARHAAIWFDGEAAWVQDLASRNGSFLNEDRISALARASSGDALRFGETRFRLGVTEVQEEEERLGLSLESLETGVCSALPSDRMRLGDGAQVDLWIPGAPEAVIGVDGPEDLWLGLDGDIEPLRVGRPFSIGGHRFVLRYDRAAQHATRELGKARYTYRIDATLEGGPGPKAVLTDTRDGRSHAIQIENRAVLLWVLARQRAADAEAGKAEDDLGWCDEPTIIQAVWGKADGASAANLRVLLCRIRRDIKDAGFDPWFLEHRSGHIRVRVDEAALT